jgi:hypothetical protein
VRRLHAFSDEERIGLPVFSPEGIETGWTLRSISKSPKYLPLYDPDYKLGSWYGSPSGTILLVEDQLSAAKYNDVTGATAVALLGCTLPQQLAVYLSDNRLSAALALDRDALHKDAKAYLKYRSILDMRIVTIRDDVKNLNDDEVLALHQRIVLP